MPPEGVGTAFQRLRTNSGATAREWATYGAEHDDRDGTLFQTFDRGAAQTTQVLTVGTIYLMGVALDKGRTITSLACAISSGATTPTNWWYVLCNSSRAVVAVTADQLSTATGTGEVSLNLASPYVVPSRGLYYVGCMFAAAVGPTLLKSNINAALSTVLTAVAPILCGTSDTGQTTPPSVSATLAAITAANAHLWMRGK